MVKQKVTIENPTGLHLRPAGLLCKAALRFQSKPESEMYNASADVLGMCKVEMNQINL